ncbi:MAG: holo-ACP synthase [Actinobacteria bacterium]|nr:holo-ACP synthase [Actinomycetota bacterium]
MTGPDGVGGIVGVGIDLVEITRVAKALERRPGLRDRLFTDVERAYCDAGRTRAKRAQRYAVRFAAKEAAMKAVGMGLRARSWHDVEVVRAGDGTPTLHVSGQVAAWADERGGTRWLVSLTHTTTSAGAIALLLGEHP